MELKQEALAPTSGKLSPMRRPPKTLVVYAILSLIINSALLALRILGYSVSGSMLGLNVTSSVLILAFAWVAAWGSRSFEVLVLDSLISVFPLVLATCVTSETRMNHFGLFLVLFVFFKAVLLAWFALTNIERATEMATRIWVLTLSFTLYASITPWVASAAWPDGDEPHYLLLTHSLLVDHDFDLANNYLQGDYKRFYPTNLGHHSVKVGMGHELPFHDVGLSIVLLPGYTLAGRLGAMLEMNLFAAVLAFGIYELAICLGGSQRSALNCWLLFGFTCPLVVYSSQIYPEIIGAAGAVWATIVFARYIKSSQNSLLIMIGSILASLPWFSIRFWMVVGPMLSVILLYIALQSRQSRKFNFLRSSGCLVLPAVLSLAIFAAFDMHYYHTPIPNAGYFLGYTLGNPVADSHLTRRPDIGFLGLLFDRSSGLVALAPVYIIAIAGIGILLRSRRWEGATIISASGLCLGFMSFSSYWGFAAWSPAGRYQLVAAALLAPVASLALRNRDLRPVAFALSTWSYLAAIQYTAFPMMRYPNGTLGVFTEISSRWLGFDLSAIFPSVQRGKFFDGEMAALWAVITILLARFGVRASEAEVSNEMLQAARL
jgi:hypothetical protein